MTIRDTTRFAPAPTGYLHLGHVLNAIYVWGASWRRMARVHLRIEDHDRQRSRPEFERAILEDLAWLGFSADGETVRQSDRSRLYEEALARLRDAGLVYACECSRADIARAISGGESVTDDRDVGAELAPPGDANELRYPGTCASKHLAETPGRALRVRLAPEDFTFIDLRHGPVTQRPSEQCGDLLVKDRDGNWTYQFAATIDDMLQDVTLVIRGDDLLASTGRQIQLARMLGRGRPPGYLHHRLIMKSPAQKLSKSDGDTGVRDLRALGLTPADVIGRAAFLGGLTRTFRPIAAREVSSIIGA